MSNSQTPLTLPRVSPAAQPQGHCKDHSHIPETHEGPEQPPGESLALLLHGQGATRPGAHKPVSWASLQALKELPDCLGLRAGQGFLGSAS